MDRVELLFQMLTIRFKRCMFSLLTYSWSVEVGLAMDEYEAGTAGPRT